MNNTTSASDRVALVFGSSGGIGRAIVDRLVEDNMAVAVHSSSDKARAESIAAEVRRKGGRAIAVVGDVADETAMNAVFEATSAEFGGIDVMVNTAGILLLSPIASLDLADLDRIYRTNIRGTFVVSQLAANHLRAGGAIINFSTTVTKTSYPNYGAYVASKSAVEGMTLVLARELRGRDVTVNTVAPGPTATPLFMAGKDESTINSLSSAPPLERLGQPNDVAETVAFLAGPARWVNGQIIYTNGGLA